MPNHATKNIYKVRLKTTDENGGTFDNIFEIKVKEPTIKPSVTLNPVPNIINTANVSVYPISGTCTDGAGDVPVAVGTVSKIIACNGGNFSDTVDVSGVSDGNVTIDASQSWGTKVGNAPQVSVQKDASKPTIAGTQSVTLTVGSADAINYDVKTGITAQDGSTDLTNALNCSVNPNYDANVV